MTERNRKKPPGRSPPPGTMTQNWPRMMVRRQGSIRVL